MIPGVDKIRDSDRLGLWELHTACTPGCHPSSIFKFAARLSVTQYPEEAVAAVHCCSTKYCCSGIDFRLGIRLLAAAAVATLGA